jgi:hypothetical protein
MISVKSVEFEDAEWILSTIKEGIRFTCGRHYHRTAFSVTSFILSDHTKSRHFKGDR